MTELSFHSEANLQNPDGNSHIGITEDGRVMYESKEAQFGMNGTVSVLDALLENKNVPVTTGFLWSAYERRQNTGIADPERQRSLIYTRLGELRSQEVIPQLGKHILRLGGGTSSVVFLLEDMRTEDAGVAALQAYHDKKPSNSREKLIVEYKNIFNKTPKSPGPPKSMPHSESYESSRHATLLGSLSTDQEKATYEAALNRLVHLGVLFTPLQAYDIMVLAEIVTAGRPVTAVEIFGAISSRLGKNLDEEKLVDALKSAQAAPFSNQNARGVYFTTSYRDGKKVLFASWG